MRIGSGGRDRTYDTSVNSRVLCQLSYSEKKSGAGGENRTPDIRFTKALLLPLSYTGELVVAKGVEPLTSRLSSARSGR